MKHVACSDREHHEWKSVSAMRGSALLLRFPYIEDTDRRPGGEMHFAECKACGAAKWYGVDVRGRLFEYLVAHSNEPREEGQLEE